MLPSFEYSILLRRYAPSIIADFVVVFVSTLVFSHRFDIIKCIIQDDTDNNDETIALYVLRYLLAEMLYFRKYLEPSMLKNGAFPGPQM